MTRDLAHLSDEALVALLARGDDGALAELYDRFGASPTGSRFASSVTPPSPRTPSRRPSSPSGGRPPASSPSAAKARTWILTLVHRRAVDLVRREQTRRTEPLKEQPESGGRTAEEEAWLRLERARVQEALKRLPDQQREAIELAYYGGFTQSELADRLGEPLGTIKSRMFTGLSRLRELLEETGHEEERWNAPEFTS